MKNHSILLFIVLFISSQSFAQQIKCKGPDCQSPLCKDMKEGLEYYEFDKGMTDKDNKRFKKSKYRKLYYQGKPYTGVRYTCPMHLGGRITSIQNWKEGARHGLQRRWHENGKLESISNYNEGKVIGMVYDYYENGVLKITDEYVDGVREGFYTKYDEKGNLIEKIEYRKGKPVAKN